MKKILFYTLLGLVFFGLIGVGTASACGWFWGGASLDPEKVVERQNQMFKNQADLLGITVDQVKQYWAEGKNRQEIMEELGISQEQLREKMKQRQEERLQEQLQILVDNGVITQDQANQRLEVMQERFENNSRGGFFSKGFGRGGFRGFNW